MVDSAAIPFHFPDVAGRKALVLGLGGGCDVITAYAFSRLLPGGELADVFYGNTKTADAGATLPVTPHVLRVSGPMVESAHRVHRRGKAWIDHAIPRAANGSPLIFMLDDQTAEQELAGQIQSLGFDLLIGIDTGGDSIATKRGRGHLGRDQRMVAVLLRTGLPLLHVVVAPGSDGEASEAKLRAAIHQRIDGGRYLGSFALDGLLPVYQVFREALGETRTPRIILAAFEDRLTRRGDRVVVPRGRKPAVPRSWLTTGFVFAPAGPARERDHR